jgi:hypothetical protein
MKQKRGSYFVLKLVNEKVVVEKTGMGKREGN